MVTSVSWRTSHIIADSPRVFYTDWAQQTLQIDDSDDSLEFVCLCAQTCVYMPIELSL